MIRPYLAEQHGLDDLRLDGLACRRERRRDLHEDSGGRVVAGDVHGQRLKLQIDLSWNVAHARGLRESPPRGAPSVQEAGGGRPAVYNALVGLLEPPLESSAERCEELLEGLARADEELLGGLSLIY